MDNLRRAILVISIVVLIGAGIVGFLLALDNITDKKESPVVTLAPDGEKYDPSKADPDRTSDPAKVIDGSTTVFAVTSNGGKKCELVFTASADYESGRIALIFFPVDTSVTLRYDDGTTSLYTLEGFYENAGLEKLADAVGGLIGLPVNGYLAFDFSAFSDLLNSFTSRDDGVEYYAPVAVNAISADGSSVSIKTGKVLYTGITAQKLLAFYRTYDNVYDAETVKFYDGSRLPQNLIAATFTDAFVTQKITGGIGVYYKENYVSFFDAFIAKCKGKAATGFPSKLAQNEDRFKAENIDAYVINTQKDASSTRLVFTGTITKADNTAGTIATKTVSKDQLNQLLKSFY